MAERHRPPHRPQGAPRPPGPIAFVLKGYPRLSETFIAQEILALEKLGLDIRLFSLRHPTDSRRHPIHDEIAAAVTYLPEYLHREPGRVGSAWRRARRLPGYRDALRIWWRDLRRDRTRNRIRRFGQAMVLAAELPAGSVRLHAHFLHTPSSVARYAAIMTGLPWSAAAHAKDIWTIPEWEKREKLADLDWLVACTQYACAHLRGLAPCPDKVGLVYHGLDLRRFCPTDAAASRRDGSDPAEPVRLLSVGRAVEKKGFRVLIEALALLPGTMHWRWTLIGAGPQLAELRRLAAQRGIAERIDWRGALNQEAVLSAYRAADLFVLPCLVGEDGDRDGLPNVLMEAQSQGLCCLSTRTSGIPELIDHLKTGVLVEPGEVDPLKGALTHLIADPERRRNFGAGGKARVCAGFDASVTVRALHDRFAGCSLHPAAGAL